MWCIYTSFHCLWVVLCCPLPREGELYIYTGVGLSALLVSTYRAMREPSERGTGNNWLHAFAYVYGIKQLTVNWSH